MKIIYTGQPPELNTPGTTGPGSIFLAGPTPRYETGTLTPQSWRPDALRVLESYRFEGAVYVPEHPPEGPALVKSQAEQIEWEWSAIASAHVVAFWVPREMKRMPALTTNIEFGMLMQSGRIVFGAPQEAEHVGYMLHACERFKIPNAMTLEATMHQAVLMNTLGLRDAALLRARDAEQAAEERKRKRAEISP